MSYEPGKAQSKTRLARFRFLGLPGFRFPFVLTETVVPCNSRYMKQADSPRGEVLLDATIEYMLRHGVADISLRPLAAKVGSKARLLIYHFGSKESLVSKAMVVVRDRVQKAFAAMVENGRGHTASQIIRAFWRWTTSKQHERYLRLFFEVHGLALQKPARYGGYLEGAVSTWVEMMAVVLPPHLSLPKRRALATLAVSTVVGLLMDYLSGGDKKRSSQALEIFAVNFDELLKAA
ncbi:MAG TPA: TetR/AcrR family transcriptional regulator [Candidatus Limnocylindrales bacterium]|nr:TetR/AcrR family transcriptional regulator [Candidatus Limnocylindrales bacterium]